MPVAPNLTVQSLELEDLETWQSVQGLTFSVPPTNAPHHDTANFMALINAKVEMIQRAPKGASHYAWIDFSIFHVIRDEEKAIATLRRLATAHLPETYTACPGCWGKDTALPSLFSTVNWRFCGGLLIGDAVSLHRLYELYETHFARIVKEQGRLVWEVNFWTYFENIGFDFGWYRADHNDSILAAPIPKRIVASLTTIPPRFALCRKTLDSLIPQVDRIYLSIPETYARFPGPVHLPQFLEESGYSKVHVLRTPDFGPATKYLGAIGHISEDEWVFVCDDDQEYHPDLIARMSTSLMEPGAYQNHYRNIGRKTSGGAVHGYVGVILHATCLRKLPDFPLPHAARFVDDQWMSVYCFKEGVKIYPSSVETYEDIFRTLQDGHELYAPEALASLNNRAEMVCELEKYFQIRFDGVNVISS